MVFSRIPLHVFLYCFISLDLQLIFIDFERQNASTIDPKSSTKLDAHWTCLLFRICNVFYKILCEKVTFQHIKICQNTCVLQWKCTCIIFYMMLRVAMSSTKNVLDFGLNFVSKTCLWGLTKLSLFDVMFLFQFWLKFDSILTALDTQNPDSMDSNPCKNGLLTLAESFFLHDIAPNPIFGRFWSLQDVSKTSPRRLKTPQDGSKTMSRRY